MKAVVDRIVQYANRYKLTNAETGEVLGTFDFDEVTGTVQQVGTEIDAELFQSIADDLAERVVSAGGELAGTIVTFSDISGTAANVASGDTSATLWGKVKNWFSRLKALAFKDKIRNSDVASDAAIEQSKVSGLENALASKANDADLAAIAKSGDLADATQDATHRVVTDTEKATWNAKQAAITGAASTIASQNLTASRALVSNGQGKVAVSAVTATELGYLEGVSSNLQTQLDDIKDGTTVVGRATNAQNAANVTAQINGHAISDIFETDGTTVKEATQAQRASADEDGNNISNTYAKQNGTYQNLIAGGVDNVGIGSTANINDYYGADYWGKEYYFGGGNNPQGSPEGISGGHLSVIRAGSSTTIQVIRTGVGSDFSGVPTTYQRDWNGSVWTDWEEIVTADGSYPTLGAGYLAKQHSLRRSTNTAGWLKIGTVPNSTFNSYVDYSCIMLIHGIFRGSSASAQAPKTAIIEIEIRKYPTSIGDQRVGVIAGDIPVSNLCSVIEDNLDMSIYLYDNYTESVNYSCEIISEYATPTGTTDAARYDVFEWGDSPAVALTSTPANAVYAVVRNNASGDENSNNIVATYAKQNGSYPTLGAGYLAKNLQFSVNTAGGAWYKVAEVDVSSVWANNANRSYSAFILLNTAHRTQASGTSLGSGLIEFDIRKTTVNGVAQINATETGIILLAGNIQADRIATSISGFTVSLYIYLAYNYEALDITVVTESNEGVRCNYITLAQSNAGTSVPSGAVYAVNRNVAAKGVTPATDSNSDDVATTEWVNNKVPHLYLHIINLSSDISKFNSGDADGYSLTIVSTNNTPYTIETLKNFLKDNGLTYHTVPASSISSLSGMYPISGWLNNSSRKAEVPVGITIADDLSSIPTRGDLYIVLCDTSTGTRSLMTANNSIKWINDIVISI